MLVEIFGSLGTMTLLDFFFGWGGGGGAGVHFDYNIHVVLQQFYSYSQFQNCQNLHITADGFSEMALILNDLYILVR